MDNRISQYPPHLQKIISERSKYTQDERVKSAEECIKGLRKLNKPSYEGALKSLRTLRGRE